LGEQTSLPRDNSKREKKEFYSLGEQNSLSELKDSVGDLDDRVRKSDPHESCRPEC